MLPGRGALLRAGQVQGQEGEQGTGPGSKNDRQRFRERIRKLTNQQLAACADELLAETHRRLGSVPQ